MKIVCLGLVIIVIEASVIPTRHYFNRVLRVAPADHNLNKLSSNTGILSAIMCALYCQDHPSFPYTEVDKRCDIYSRVIVDEMNANVSTSKMYFSKASGVYQITATGGRTIKAFLDMDTADGPWTVIQRRTSKDVDFYRNWTDYKNGFGDLLGNFWIGNDNLHLLTTTPRILRVELEAGDGTKGYAEYSKFQVANEDQNYRLLVQGFSGNVTDGMAYHNNQSFSTYDSDNDEHPGKCAISEHGAWWYKSCYEIQLNGRYPTEEGFPKKELMSWYHFSDVLTKSKMMIR